MTPKEKAIELIDKLKIKSYTQYTEEGVPVSMSTRRMYRCGKESALIAVDEIIYELKKYQDADIWSIDFWQNVKVELENPELEKL